MAQSKDTRVHSGDKVRCALKSESSETSYLRQVADLAKLRRATFNQGPGFESRTAHQSSRSLAAPSSGRARCCYHFGRQVRRRRLGRRDREPLPVGVDSQPDARKTELALDSLGVDHRGSRVRGRAPQADYRLSGRHEECPVTAHWDGSGHEVFERCRWLTHRGALDRRGLFWCRAP